MPIHDIVNEIVFRIMWIGFSFALTWLSSFVCGETLIYFIANKQGNLFYATTLTEALTTYISCAFTFGLVYSVPLWLYHSWCFVVPSQTQTQRHSFARFTFLSLASLFCLICLTYLYLLPNLCRFFAYFAETSSTALQIQLYLKIADFIRLCFQIFLLVAMFSQIPIVVFICILHGWNYARSRRFVFVSCLLIGAFVAPPDLIGQLVISACVFVCCEFAYCVSLFLRWVL